MNRSSLRQLQSNIRYGLDGHSHVEKLDDEELDSFERALRKIVSFYWTVPETELKLSQFVCDPKLDKKLKKNPPNPARTNTNWWHDYE